MTSDPTYIPSPELVEAPLRVLLRHDGYPEDHYPLAPQIDEDNRALTAAMLTAAVAYRHPTGDPELVPWEQVQELVDAARAIPHFVEERRYMEDCWGESVIVCHRSDCDHQCVRPGKTQCRGEWDEFGCWYSPDEYGRYEATAILRAALAPFTQEPQP